MPTYRFCPVCATALVPAIHGGKERVGCPSCGWVFWDNPVPVVAAIVERNGHVLLVRSHGWPETWYGLVTGFLEKKESPAEAALREVEEETGLKAEMGAFIGMYPFERMNQIIMAYHVTAHAGDITLDTEELAGYKEVPLEEVTPWAAGTGYALRDWLRSRGIEREVRPFS
ncbi:MAG: NUDIX domain-containing protein [Bacteroidetes bacterium]|nr:MAG: NUDIX domain-containing protein [Bacteroidota bacterium]